ncbi:unnamed protein product [Caenorhabditis bovis]|uniref:DUF4211 domain-containing protein n=1 Tax=Caenorhabditis bovis TaxID=2654633 RepID=A0A8S1EG70_9PELO|nr:unnamed protein product [Caenorhabditis bovis]
MEQNKKTILPAFPPGGFPAQFAGIPNNSANALMSTLQTLQMQSLGNAILPPANITSAEFSQRVLLEQMKAVQDMYNSFTGVKAVNSAQDLTNAAAQAAALSLANSNAAKFANTIFPNSAFLAGDLPFQSSTALIDRTKVISSDSPTSGSSSSHPSSSTPHEIDVGTNHSMDVPTVSMPNTIHHPKAVHGLDLQAVNILNEEWMKNSGLSKSLEAAKMISTSIAIATPATMTDIPAPATSTADVIVAPEPEEETKEQQQDDVMEMFGLSNLDDDPVVHEPETAVNMGLSPVQFTPPDSPTEAMTTDFLFGLGPSTEEPSAPANNLLSENSAFTNVAREDVIRPTPTVSVAFKAPELPSLISTDQLTNKNNPNIHNGGPSTSGISIITPLALKMPQLSNTNDSTVPRTNPSTPHKSSISGPSTSSIPGPSTPSPAQKSSPIPKETVYTRPFIKSNKIPVYKMKINKLDNLDAIRKENDKNYDAFEFDEDDENETMKPEVLKDKETDILAQCDSKSKNVYVPGIGFAITTEVQPDQENFKNAMPKTKAIGEPGKPGLSRTNNHSAATRDGHTFKLTPQLADSRIVNLGDSIRLRRNQQMTCNFLKISMSNDTECTRNIRRTTKDPDRPPLPKYFIRISNVVEPSETPGKRKKKRRKLMDDDEEDSDWDGYTGHKKIRSISKTIYELCLVEPGKEKHQRPRVEFVQNNSLNGQTQKRPPKNLNDIESVKYRLSKFGSAEGILPKGTYVVCKADILRDDCALWRVDNQNLLQKFPPLPVGGNRIIYKSSSTYSGWCEQISHQYYRIAVNVLKQNRSETTIEPEIPISELFPAMTEEIFKTPRSIFISPLKKGRSYDDQYLSKDNLRIAINTLLSNLLTHALTMTHLQEMQEKNDWSLLRSITEIDEVSSDAEVKLKNHLRINDRYIDHMKNYTRCHVIKSEYYKNCRCQICHRHNVIGLLQLYNRKSYNTLTLQYTPFDDYDESISDSISDSISMTTPLPAVDIFTCEKCTIAGELLHKVIHLKYNLLRTCEEKLEFVGTEFIEQAPEKIVDMVKKDRTWICGIVNDITDMFKRIKMDYP